MKYTDAGSRSTGRSEALAQLRRAGVMVVRFEYAGQCCCRREKPVTFHDASGVSSEAEFLAAPGRT